MTIPQIRIKDVVLYGTLLAAFASAWLSDRYPQAAGVALALGVIVGLISVAYIAILSARLRQKERQQAVSHQHVDFARKELIESNVATIYFHGRASSEALRMHLHRVQAHDIARLHALQMQLLVRAHSRSLEKRLIDIPEEMRSWELEKQGDRNFTVSAGAFVIEVFQGHTNIKINDPDRVSVQHAKNADERHIRNLVAQGLRTPVYN